MIIRPEQYLDFDQIRAVHDRAFGQPNEGLLIDALRREAFFTPKMSLVAERDDSIVGHILFSRLKSQGSQPLQLVSLAPLAVLPERQRQGIGAKLVAEGLRNVKELGFDGVLVVGDPSYYGRFGFQRKLAETIQSPYQCDAFMGLELRPGALEHCARVEYPPPFQDV